MHRISYITALVTATFLMFTGVAVAATPAAKYVGAVGSSFATANSTLGPLHATKVFYDPSTPLPSTYPSNNYGAPAGTLIIVAYKVATTNVQSFVRSVPMGQPVTMVYWQEPEEHLSASTFVSNFEKQSNLIQAVGNPNVTVADDASTYGYNSGQPGYGCSYIVPNTYVNYYYGDVYEQQDAGLAHQADFQRWLTCTHGLNRARGLAEYGLGNCKGNTYRANTMASDATWLKANMSNLHVINYWWDGGPGTNTSCANTYQFTDQAAINVWKTDFEGQ